MHEDQTSLVDKKDNPPAISPDFTWIQTLLGYLLAFGAGYLSAIALKRTRKSKASRIDPLIKKIEASQDAKSLLQMLMAQDTRRFHASIEKLENALYSNGKIDLTKIKQEIKKSIQRRENDA